MVRLVLLDVDGTLIRTGGVGVQAFARTLSSEFQIHHGTDRVRFGGRTDPSLVRELFGYAGIEPSAGNIRRFFDAYVFWLDHLLAHSANGGPCPGVWDFLFAVRALPTPPALGLLTGNIRLGAEIKLRHYGLWDVFETGAFGDDHEDRNTLAAVARDRGSRLLGRSLRGSEVLVVGDTHRDIECGRAIGARVLAVATGPAPVDELESAGPDWAVPSLAGVCPADVCG